MLTKILKVDFDFHDERGTLTQLVHKGYNQINVIISNAGVKRGGHYHNLNNEAFYIIKGKLKFEAKRKDLKEVFEFGPGDFFGIGPNIIHSFNFLEDTILVSLYDRGVELEDNKKDIVAE